MEHTTKEAGSPSARAKRPSRMQWPIMVRECRCRACGRHLYLYSIRAPVYSSK